MAQVSSGTRESRLRRGETSRLVAGDVIVDDGRRRPGSFDGALVVPA